MTIRTATTRIDESTKAVVAGNANADLPSSQPVLDGDRIEDDMVTPGERGIIVDQMANEECQVSLMMIENTDTQNHAENSAFVEFIQSTLDTATKGPKTRDEQEESNGTTKSGGGD
jgi:hypothetical protein